MNARETRKAIEEGQMAGNPGNGGNISAAGKSGKISRSTKAPAVIGAVLAKRANGANKAQIARDLKISHNTVDKILDETEFDDEIALGRAKAKGLIPEALEGVKKAFAKGDGATSCRFLEGVGVLGEDKSRRNGTMQASPWLHQQIINFMQPGPTPGREQPRVIDAQTVTKESGNDGS